MQMDENGYLGNGRYAQQLPTSAFQKKWVFSTLNKTYLKNETTS